MNEFIIYNINNIIVFIYKIIGNINYNCKKIKYFKENYKNKRYYSPGQTLYSYFNRHSHPKWAGY